MKLTNMPHYVVMGGLKLAYISGGEVAYVDAPKNPYGFVDVLAAMSMMDRMNFEETSLKCVYTHRPVYRFEFDLPAKVGSFGRELEQKGLRSYETDIPYVRRLMIDRELEMDYRGVVYLDIELDDSRGWRKYGEMPLLSYAYSFGDDVKFVAVNSDKRRIYELIDEMVRREVFVIAGWNVEFDYNHLKALTARMSRAREVLKHVELIDLRKLYMFHKKGIGSYSLSNVSAYEGWGEKQRRGKVSSLSLEELEKYNTNDVELLLKLEERYNFVKRTLTMAKELSIPVSDILTGETVVWDYLLLRRLRELGYVAPRKNKWKKKGYEGAYILEPKPGLKKNVAVFDFVSLYPSIIMRDKVDVFEFSGEVVPYYMAHFLKKKNEAESAGDMIGREIYKILMNSCYGMFGYEGSRYFDEKKAAHVTIEGRKALMRLIEFLQGLGIEVYFGDTDSVFIDSTAFENLKALEAMINKQFYPLQVKLDKLFGSILFFGRMGGKGVKKRYIGLTVDGKLVERGVETRRGDWCEYTKKVMREVALKILRGASYEEVEQTIASFKKELLAGKVRPEELLITRHLKEELDYKTMTPWFKLWKELVSKGLMPEESREVSYWLGRDGALVYEVNQISYMEYWKKQIEPPLKRLLESIQINRDSKLI